MANNSATLERWSIPAVMALLAIIGLVVPKMPALRTDRPKGSNTGSLTTAKADVVESRLWEDPFLKVNPTPQVPGDMKNRTAPVGEAAFELDFGRARLPASFPKNDSLALFVVTLPAGPDAERTERRLRDRYALTMAMQRAGFAAIDGPQLDVIETKRGEDVVRLGVQRFGDETGKPKCVVMWMPDEYFRRVATRLSLERWWRAEQSETKSAPISVIGPATSDSLVALRSSITKGEELRVYSPWATMSEERMQQVTGETQCDAYEKAVRRFAIDDDRLIAALVEELRLRRVQNANSDLLVVAEADDTYSRALAGEFEAKWNQSNGQTDAAKVKMLWYQRGIDGQLAEEDRPDQRTAAESLARTDGTAIQDAIERPLGRGQLDYIRRSIEVATHSSMLDAQHISAVVVLGSDVYDKLLVIRAMRELANDAIFATTDLDARFLHPRELPWTRNLIIATSFQLRTSDKIHAGIPPFRDQYQTATFAAVLSALREHNLFSKPDEFQNWDAKPQSHSGGLASATTDAASEKSTAASASEPGAAHTAARRPLVVEIGNRSEKLLSPRKVSEQSSDWYPPNDARLDVRIIKTGAIMLLVGVALACLLDWFTRIKSAQRSRVREQVRKDINRILQCFGIPGLVVGAMMLTAHFMGETQEPLSWTTGTSAWPAVFIHAMGIGAAVFFVKAFKRQAGQLRDEADKELGLRLMERRKRIVDGGDDGTPPAPRSQRFYHYTWKPHLVGEPGEVDIDANIDEYVARANWWSRLVRAVVQTAIVCVATLLAFKVFGSKLVPVRGEFSFWCTLVVGWLSLFSTVFLIVIIFDASLLCERVLYTLGQGRSRYSADVLERFSKLTGVRGVGAPSACDVTMIARLTEVVSSAIYLPMIVLIIHLIARERAFDRWAWDFVLLTLGVLSVAALVIAGWLLRRVATQTRERELAALAQRKRSISAQLRQTPAAEMAVAKAEAERQIGDLDDAVAYINAQQMGAFTNLLEQPWLRAALVLLGSLGLSGTLDWLKILPM